MKQLIKNELYKILKKKSTVVMMIVAFAFVLLTNLVYKSINNYDMQEIAKISDYENIEENYLKKAMLDYDTSSLTSEVALASYAMEKEKDIYSASNGKLVQAFFNEYNLIIVLWLILISCTIVGFELQSGNIKNLLMVPYSRKQILLSKVISILIVLIFFIIYLLLMQLIVGSFILDYTSLFDKNVYYNYQLNLVIEINVFKEFLLNLCGYLPMYILLIAISILLALLVMSSYVPIIITLFIYMLASNFGELISKYHFYWLRFLPFVHWNLTDYFFGRNNDLLYTKWPFSVIICMSYASLIIYLAFWNFNNKNV